MRSVREQVDNAGQVPFNVAWDLAPPTLHPYCWEAEDALEPFHEDVYGAVCDEVASAGCDHVASAGWRPRW